MRVALGPLEEAYRSLADRASAADWAGRLSAKDPTLWKRDEVSRRSIENRLGWLDEPLRLRDEISGLRSWATEVKSETRRAVLLGMGGSSLAPEVLDRVLGPEKGPRLVVLDTTSPDAIRAIDPEIDPARSLFFVSSKSGATIETASLFAHFWGRAKGLSQPGRRFVAITDRGSALADVARERDFRRVFLNPESIGGRYSALSFFGLAPAAVAGVDVPAVLGRGLEALRAAAAPDSEAIRLGLFLGAGALTGRDKLTLLFGAALAPLGAWIEQLVAESTGKEGKGILPVDGEPVGAPDSYGPDRLFVATTLASQYDAGLEAALDRLEAAGRPVVRIRIPAPEAIGAEFVRWEVATAIAAAAIGVNPFDEPDVSAAKAATRRALDAYRATGELNQVEPIRPPFRGLRLRLDAARPPDYIAFLAYLPPGAETEAALRRVRVILRDRQRVTTTFGWGPRYLHSTGQYHKGGPPTGVYVQITCDAPTPDIEIPGEPFSFGTLFVAQAAGDMDTLRARGRRALRLDLGRDIVGGLAALERAVAG